jgi:hypothetical protein
VDEGRKRVLLIAAAILAARKLAPMSPGRVPATICAITDAIQFANQIMTEIDRLWPAGGTHQ